jgi:hypothetical protein
VTAAAIRWRSRMRCTPRWTRGLDSRPSPRRPRPPRAHRAVGRAASGQGATRRGVLGRRGVLARQRGGDGATDRVVRVGGDDLRPAGRQPQKVLVCNLILGGRGHQQPFGPRLDHPALAGPDASRGGDHIERRRAPRACDGRVRSA